MKERIEDKIAEIEGFLEFLISRTPETLEEYKSDLDKKAICERYAEKIIEATVDLAFLTARHLYIKIPAQASDTEIFVILSRKEVISEQLSEKLQDAKGMRNIIAHEYGKIDDEVVYEAISSQLEKDIREFIDAARAKLRLKEKVT